MSIIHSKHDIRIKVPSSFNDPGLIEAWLSSMNDSGWRVLTDFRNWPNWMPGIHSVEHAVSEPPARGSKLQIEGVGGPAICCIDRWDPPRSLHISIDYPSGQIACGFLITSNAKATELGISLELERSLVGFSRLASIFFQWRLNRLSSEMLANLAARTRPAKSLQG